MIEGVTRNFTDVGEVPPEEARLAAELFMNGIEMLYGYHNLPRHEHLWLQQPEFHQAALVHYFPEDRMMNIHFPDEPAAHSYAWTVNEGVSRYDNGNAEPADAADAEPRNVDAEEVRDLFIWVSDAVRMQRELA